MSVIVDEGGLAGVQGLVETLFADGAAEVYPIDALIPMGIGVLDDASIEKYYKWLTEKLDEIRWNIKRVRNENLCYAFVFQQELTPQVFISLGQILKAEERDWLRAFEEAISQMIEIHDEELRRAHLECIIEGSKAVGLVGIDRSHGRIIDLVAALLSEKLEDLKQNTDNEEFERRSLEEAENFLESIGYPKDIRVFEANFLSKAESNLPVDLRHQLPYLMADADRIHGKN